MSLKNIWFLCLLDCHSLMFLGKKKIAAKLINLFFKILTLCNCETSLPRDSPSLIFVLYSLFVFIFDFFRFFFFFLVSIFLPYVHNCETSLPRGSPSHYIIVYLCLLFSLCLLAISFFYLSFFLLLYSQCATVRHHSLGTITPQYFITPKNSIKK